MPAPAVDGGAPRSVDLDITGMTCASCVSRVEKKLNRIDGVHAVVNLALERASVTVAGAASDADLVAAVQKGGYGARVHERRGRTVPDASGDDDSRAGRGGEAQGFRRRAIVSATLSIPVLLLSMVPPLQFPGWQWAAFALTTVVVAWCALPFHKAAATNLRHGATTMDTLVSMGVLAAYLWSAWAMIVGDAGMIGMKMDFTLTPSLASGHHPIYFESAAIVTTLILVGRWAQASSIDRSAEALRALADLGARTARLLVPAPGGTVTERQIDVDALTVGDTVSVRTGEKVPTDGVVVAGAGAVDESMLTGESVPVEVSEGMSVAGATILRDGVLTVRTTAVGGDTRLARIAELVERAQTEKAPVQRLVDRISAVFVPIVIGVALLTLVGWLLAGHGVEAAFTSAVAVLVIACPCALGLATPTAIMAGTGRGAELGILIRTPEVLEATHRIDTIVLDKTGTLTTGEMTVQAVVPAAGIAEADLLALAAAVESASNHPIAQAIVRAASSRDPAFVAAEVQDARTTAGRGVTARLDGATVEVRAALPGEALNDGLGEGRTVSVVVRDGRILGAIAVADTVRAETPDALAQLRALGIRPLLATGDNEAAARSIGSELGLDEVHAAMLPEDKLNLVRTLRADGRSVAMVGDGINDTAALASADLGIAMGTGTDAAMATGDIVLTRGSIETVPLAVRLARRTLSTIRWNLFWAFIYNVIAIPLAVLGLLGPMIAGAAMAFSSVFVVTNSLRLRSFR